MNKLFFFRNTTDKQASAENAVSSEHGKQRKTRNGHSSGNLRASLLKPQNHTPENQNLDPVIGLRRSRSFSSAAFMGKTIGEGNLSGLSDQSSSPCSSSSSVNAQQHIRSSRCRGRTLTPERHAKANRSIRVPLEDDYVGRKPLSSRSSRSSSVVSNEVVDLYIDGEQHNGRSSPMSKTSLKNHAKHDGVKKPPRIHCTAPASPTGTIKDNPRPPSFRGARELDPHPSSGDWVEAGFGRAAPKELAKHVAEKLSRDFNSDVPITIQDVYNRSLNKKAFLMSDTAFHKGFAPDDALRNGSHCSIGGDYEDEVDVELKYKFQEAKNRILSLSVELEQESFLHDIEFNVPAFVQRVKGLTEEKMSLALELSAALLADRASMKEQISSLSLELESRTLKLQNENNEIQSTMEKELDRRSNDWSSKVENFQARESRLRERVRELAEQNVSLQREVSSLSEMETSRHSLEKQITDLTALLEATRRENHDLQKGICELQDKYKIANEDKLFTQQSFREKEEESKDLHACVTRLLRTCSDQDKTINGLRGEFEELVHKKHPMENSDRRVQKLHLEQIRLTEVEQILRREIESYKTEIASLRRENISLLNRLRGCGDNSGFLTFKLDEELRGRLDLLEKQGLSLLDDSTRLCSKLLESLKRVSRSVGKENIEVNRSSLDGEFIMESGLKVQSFRQGTESLMRSLQNVSTVLHEKSDLSFSNSQTKSSDDSSAGLQNRLNLQDNTKSELKAEMLLTSLFRESLYAKSREIEQLQAEVATAARSNDVLRCEVQNALDSLSTVNHRLNELELQMIKREEKIQQLENDVQERTGILSKVTEERDMIWEEVKQVSEQNMLWNSEVNLLKKKIESLEGDLLLKEGQIDILKDNLGSKPFDLLASPSRSREFML